MREKVAELLEEALILIRASEMGVGTPTEVYALGEAVERLEEARDLIRALMFGDEEEEA